MEGRDKSDIDNSEGINYSRHLGSKSAKFHAGALVPDEFWKVKAGVGFVNDR